MTKIIIQPQRYLANKGWRLCEAHQASKFAVLLSKRGKSSVLVRADSRKEAEYYAASARRVYEQPALRYSLGARMPKQGKRKALYISSQHPLNKGAGQ